MQLVCPLCGKLTPEATFLSKDFVVDDVYGVDVRGLGRGKGFSHSEWFSILHDRRDIIEVLKSRVLDLAELFEIEVVEPDAVDPRDDVITSLSETMIKQKMQLYEKNILIRRLKEQIEDLSDDVVDDFEE